MAKLLLALTFIVMTSHLYAQVEFRGYLRSAYSTGISKLTDFRIGKNNTWYLACAGSNSVSLPDTGTYVLQSPRLAADGDSILVRVSTTIVADTFKQADIIPPAFAGCWLFCGKKCSGRQVDFYSNGKKRLEGTFKKGLPVRPITYYRPDGSVKRVEYYDRKGNSIPLFETFSPSSLQTGL